MNKEQLLQLASENDMVSAVTEILIQRFDENPTKLSQLAPYNFLNEFVARIQGNDATGVHRYWYGGLERDMKEIPGIGVASTYLHRGIFNTSREGFHSTLITEDFVYYAMDRIDMQPGHKKELADILTSNNLRVPFEVPDVSVAEDEDKRAAVKAALYNVAMAKPVAFTRMAKEELRIRGFDPKALKKPEVMALLEAMFE